MKMGYGLLHSPTKICNRISISFLKGFVKHTCVFIFSFCPFDCCASVVSLVDLVVGTEAIARTGNKHVLKAKKPFPILLCCPVVESLHSSLARVLEWRKIEKQHLLLNYSLSGLSACNQTVLLLLANVASARRCLTSRQTNCYPRSPSLSSISPSS